MAGASYFGSGVDYPGSSRATLWDGDTAIDLGAALVGWTETVVRAINDTG